MNQKNNLSALGKRLAILALKILRENDGTMSLSDLMKSIESKEGSNISEDANSRYPNDRRRKWEVSVQYECDRFVKAAFLKKKSGVWYLTPEGEVALESGEKTLLKKADNALREWKEKQRRAKEKEAISDRLLDNSGDSDDESPEAPPKSESGVEEYMSVAMGEIIDYIREKEAYEFQNLCAALLRGMNYHVRDVAGPGPDGGIDIIAYTDPLGGTPPRLKVQVKHKGNKTSTPDLAQLAGRLTDGDIGVFISSGGYAAGCRDFVRNNGKHMELINLPRFIELWREHYDKLSEEDKSLLPLQPVYFLDRKRAVSE